MSLRTPLSRVRGLGPAKDGLRHWWTQRLTAVALVPLTLWFVVQVVTMTSSGYEDVTAWMAAPSVSVMLLLLIFTVFLFVIVLGFHYWSFGELANHGYVVKLRIDAKLITILLIAAPDDDRIAVV